ncbi:MAG: hypothetical protein R2867_38630 [Caldilineaceae bacterium]
MCWQHTLDYGDRTWSNPNVWVDNPKAAAPTWTNLWRSEPEPEHLVLTAGEPDEGTRGLFWETGDVSPTVFL